MYTGKKILPAERQIGKEKPNRTHRTDIWCFKKKSLLSQKPPPPGPDKGPNDARPPGQEPTDHCGGRARPQLHEEAGNGWEASVGDTRAGPLREGPGVTLTCGPSAEEGFITGPAGLPPVLGHGHHDRNRAQLGRRSPHGPRRAHYPLDPAAGDFPEGGG